MGVENVEGGLGDDTLVGNGMNNELIGWGGNDRLFGGPGTDRLLGRSGDDEIHADDGIRDSVVCGDGVDSAAVDPSDAVTASCEDVTTT